jgi:predicted ATPase
VREVAGALIDLSAEHGFVQDLAAAKILCGWGVASKGQSDEGIAQMLEGLADYAATGAAARRSYYLSLLAEAYGAVGQPDDGLRVLDEALEWSDRTGERRWDRELARIKGVLLAALSDIAAAEQALHRAIDNARESRTRSLELRAVTSLARLWHHQGKRQEARNLLAPIYNWFTEGFDTPDLKEAKALLNELS